MKYLIGLLKVWGLMFGGVVICILLMPLGPAVLLGLLTDSIGYGMGLGFVIGLAAQFLVCSFALARDMGW